VDDFQRPKKNGVAVNIPAPPKVCLCGKHGNINVMLVVDERGRRHAGAGGDFTFKGEMRSGYTFLKWIVECWDCYDKRMKAYRKQEEGVAM